MVIHACDVLHILSNIFHREIYICDLSLHTDSHIHHVLHALHIYIYDICAMLDAQL